MRSKISINFDEHKRKDYKRINLEYYHLEKIVYYHLEYSLVTAGGDFTTG